MTRTRQAFMEAKNKASIAAEDRKVKREELAFKKKAHREGLAKDIGLGVPTAMGTLMRGAGAINPPEIYKRWLEDYSKIFSQSPTYVDPNAYGYRDNRSFLNRVIQDDKSVAHPIIVHPWQPAIGPAPWGDTVNGEEVDASAFPVNKGLARTIQLMGANTGRNIDWDPGDVGLLIFGASEILVATKMLEQALRSYNTSDGANTAKSRLLISALGFNEKDFSAHYTSYLGLYHDIVKSINKNIPLPINLGLYHRKLAVAGTFLVEHDSPQSLIHLLKPMCVGTISEDLTSLEYVDLFNNCYFDTYKLWIDTAMSRFTFGSDVKQIFSDIRNAFKSDLMKYPEVDITDKTPVEFIRDEFMLTALLNGNVIDYSKSAGALITWDNVGESPALFTGEFPRIYIDESGFLTMNTRFMVTSRNNANAQQLSEQVYAYIYLLSENTRAQTAAKTPLTSGRQFVSYVEPTSDVILEGTRFMSEIHEAEPVLYEGKYYLTCNIRSCGTEILRTPYILHSPKVTTNAGLVYEEYTPAIGETISLMGAPTFYRANAIYINSSYTHIGNSTPSLTPDGSFRAGNYSFLYPYSNLESLNDMCIKSIMYIANTEFQSK